MDPLSAAQLAIYVVLTFPCLYLLYKHSPSGLLGWLFLTIFCTLQLVGGALNVSSSGSSGGAIVGNIGLSPLLAATSGFLHEARHYLLPGLNRKLEWALVAQYHVLVGAGVGLVGAGSGGLTKPENTPENMADSLKKIKIGMGILTAAWVLLIGGCLVTAFSTRRSQKAVFESKNLAKKMFSSIWIALVFIGIRIIYTLVAFTSQTPYLSPTTGAMPIRVLLAFLPTLLATLAFVAAGFATRNIKRAADRAPCGSSLSGAPSEEMAYR